MNDTATCKTCPWWAVKGRPREIGDCRLHGPRADDGGGIWPVTRDVDWCGEHPDRRWEQRNAGPTPELVRGARLFAWRGYVRAYTDHA